MLPWWCFVFVWMTLCTFYILVYTSACGEATCDELWFFFYHLQYYGGCQYVKGTKQILIAVCVDEFSGLHSNFLVCKLQLYTVNSTVLFCKCVYSFSVFFTKLFWQPQLPKLFCKNYRFFYSVLNIVFCILSTVFWYYWKRQKYLCKVLSGLSLYIQWRSLFHLFIGKKQTYGVIEAKIL